jgi:uncharacterized protein (TIGR03118 family)
MRTLRISGVLAIILSGAVATAQAGNVAVLQANLVTDDPSVNGAQITDGNLRNSWGGTFDPSGGSFWVANNHSGIATVYSVNSSGVTKDPTEVTIPVFGIGTGNPTGVAFNTGAGAGAFNGDRYIFVSEDGTISGWRSGQGSTAEILKTGSPDNVYKGVTVATIGGNTYLLAANFKNGSIDVLKGSSSAPDLPGKFVDPNLPGGYAPFNIQFIGGKFYVTFALQAPGGQDDSPGAGHGFVTAFDSNGTFLGRVASQGNLNSPWGLAIAPTSFGSLAGDLLVGNFGDGHINAYNLATNSLDGFLTTPSGQALAIDGLWSLIVGGGGNAGNPRDVYFTAGPNDEVDGLFGQLSAIPEPSSLVSGLIALFVGSLVSCRSHLLRTTQERSLG